MLASPPKQNHTRLRDFMPKDITMLATQKVASVRVWDIATAKVEIPLKRNTSGHLLSSVDLATTPEKLEYNITNVALKSNEHIQNTQGTKQKSATRKKMLSLVLRVGSTIALFAILLKSVSWSTLLVSLNQAQHPILLIGLAIGTLGVVISSYQWRVLLQGETINFDLADLVNLYLVGTAFSHFLPTGMGGDAVKAVYVGKESGKNEGAASAVVMSRITGFFGMFIVALVVLALRFKYFTPSLILWFLVLSFLVGGMITGSVFFVTLLPKLFKGKWTQHRIFTTVARIGNAISEAARRPRDMSVATVYGVIFWIAACLNYYAYAVAIGMHVSLYFYFVAIPMISLITFLPISINGFGVRESAFVYIFATAHVAAPTALLLALIMDAQVLFFGVVGGIIYTTIGYKKKVKVV